MTEQTAQKILADITLASHTEQAVKVVMDAFTIEAADCEARVQAERERCAQVLDEWAKAYPTKLFTEPEPGQHAKTVDGCFASAGRYLEVAALQKEVSRLSSKSIHDYQVEIGKMQAANDALQKELAELDGVEKSYAKREAALQRQLEPSPCGVVDANGYRHRRADWAGEEWVTYEINGNTVKQRLEPDHCLACRREQEIRRDERERCAQVCDKGFAACLNRHDCHRQDAGFIRALPEREDASRKEAK